MKIKTTISIITLALTTCLWASNSFATTLTQTGGAGTAVKTGANASGGPLTFAVSPSVLMMGDSTANNFAVVAGHNQAVGKDDGKAYGLASDSSATYYTALTAATVVTGFADSDSSTFNASWSTF